LPKERQNDAVDPLSFVRFFQNQKLPGRNSGVSTPNFQRTAVKTHLLAAGGIDFGQPVNEPSYGPVVYPLVVASRFEGPMSIEGASVNPDWAGLSKRS